MRTTLIMIHLIASLIMILVVICQSSKGSEMGAIFGGGSSQTAFGSQGAGGFLQKVTVTCAVIFMVTSLSLAILSSRQERSLIRGIDSESPIETPMPGAIPQAPVESGEQKQELPKGQGGMPSSSTTPSSSLPVQPSSLPAPDASSQPALPMPSSPLPPASSQSSTPNTPPVSAPPAGAPTGNPAGATNSSAPVNNPQ